ncbi:hypothetical protein [Nocardia asiatica]|uniref:hypothetical protein n=1 Tax=Nocardia asiatica TaxID=209252 RepID=UPI002454A51E|nr:hypothetical protein [Nocardia asiatica]
MSEEEAEYELFMPFVTVKSNGGPHDDTAYVAGWEMGALDAQLKTAASVHAESLTVQVHTANMPQVDLLAMRHGFSIEHFAYEECPNWSEVAFTRSTKTADD